MAGIYFAGLGDHKCSLRQLSRSCLWEFDYLYLSFAHIAHKSDLFFQIRSCSNLRLTVLSFCKGWNLIRSFRQCLSISVAIVMTSAQCQQLRVWKKMINVFFFFSWHMSIMTYLCSADMHQQWRKFYTFIHMLCLKLLIQDPSVIHCWIHKMSPMLVWTN